MISLRLRLMIIISVSLSLLWGLVAVWMFLDMRQELRTALDDRLAASAKMVAGLVVQLQPSGGQAAPGWGSTLDVIARDGLACEVSLLRGEVIAQTMARSAGSPGLSELLPGYSTHMFGGKQWRTYVLEQNGVRIATADRIDLREVLLRDVALSVGIPFMVALAGSLLLLRVGIAHGLAPVERIRRVLAQRSPADDAPLPQIAVPMELHSLVATIKRLLHKVAGVIERERRFTEHAAHELRTPLTAIKTHLQVARMALSQTGVQGDAGSMPYCLQSAEQGVLRLQTMLEQLLMLARLDANVDKAGSAAGVIVGEVLQHVLHDLPGHYHVSECMQLDVSEAVRRIWIGMPEALLASALRNLLDNAFRYSGAMEKVLLRVESRSVDKLCFSVIDEGPGLSLLECQHALERFWRKDGSDEGSGLGLPIVRAIAENFGGELILLPGAKRGLEAHLTVPLQSAGTIA